MEREERRGMLTFVVRRVSEEGTELVRFEIPRSRATLMS